MLLFIFFQNLSKQLSGLKSRRVNLGEFKAFPAGGSVQEALREERGGATAAELRGSCSRRRASSGSVNQTSHARRQHVRKKLTAALSSDSPCESFHAFQLKMAQRGGSVRSDPPADAGGGLFWESGTLTALTFEWQVCFNVSFFLPICKEVRVQTASQEKRQSEGGWGGDRWWAGCVCVCVGWGGDPRRFGMPLMSPASRDVSRRDTVGEVLLKANMAPRLPAAACRRNHAPFW